MPAQTPTAVIRALDGFRLREAIRLTLPKEHGSWSLALEPIALGLLVAPSWAGIPLALAASAGFFLRRPVKISLQAQPDPRRSLAAICVGALLFVAAASLLLAMELGGVTRLWPLIPAALAGSLFAWFDARGANREGAAELAGASAFALLPATFASLAGWPAANSLALAAVMLARSVPTVMVVRTFLRRRKGGSVSPVPALLTALAATGILGWLALWSLVPWSVAVFSVLLAARAFWLGSPAAARWSARRLGYLELFMGAALVIVAAATWWR
ncbi:MAG TPA: YwiC-like family protein [bacterium]|nr:YwiC-like family protein [bacterium]